MPSSSKINLTDTYDSVLIGSGPINIIEAAYLKSLGKSVLIIEERDHPAGAWTTIKHPNIPEVEIGCHIWDVDKETYDFLAKFFGLNLVPLNPRPRIYKRKIRFPYDWKQNAIGAKQIMKRMGKFQFGALKQDFRTPVYRLSVKPSLYLYPENGAKDIKEAIQRTIDKFNIPILYKHQLDQLICEDDKAGVSLKLSDGKLIKTQECVLTSLSSIREFKINGKDIQFAYRTTDYVHMHLLLKDYRIKPFSYDRVMDSTLVHRVSDMTSQVKNEIPGNSVLICVGIFEAPYKSIPPVELENRVMTEIKRLKYISGDGTVLANGVNAFTAYYNQPNLHHQIQSDTKNSIRVLRSTNFTYGLSAQLNRWKSLVS